MSVLTEHEDPRVVESPPRFEKPPYAGPVTKEYYEDAGYLPQVNQDGSDK